MTWQEVCDDPALQDLPYQIELNKWGNIEMTPVPPNWHGMSISEIGFLLHTLQPSGVVAVRSAVDTAENTKVVDVIWISLARRRASQSEYSYTVTPEICVEILSPSNHPEEQMYKGQLYLQAGAEEFWLCGQQGEMRFLDAAGPLERSQLCPAFPTRVEIPE